MDTLIDRLAFVVNSVQRSRPTRGRPPTHAPVGAAKGNDRGDRRPHRQAQRRDGRRLGRVARNEAARHGPPAVRTVLLLDARGALRKQELARAARALEALPAPLGPDGALGRREAHLVEAGPRRVGERYHYAVLVDGDGQPGHRRGVCRGLEAPGVLGGRTTECGLGLVLLVASKPTLG